MTPDEDTFEDACFRAAGMFVNEKQEQGCTRSIFYFSRPELEDYQSWRIPKGCVVKVTVEFAPEAETES